MNDSESHATGGTPRKPEPGLHLVSTPIGAARDITLRALDILAGADVLAAEDTRTLRRLLEIHGVPVAGRPILAYHDHNGDAARPRLLAELAAGKSVVYASEAGTPLVADPGLKLARAAILAGQRVLAAPGASAVLAALAVAGLPTDRFLFAGFPPSTASARRTWLAELADVPATLVIYESPKRVHKSLGDMCEIFGMAREMAICRELTKRFEEVIRGTIGDLSTRFAEQDPKGEIVLVIDRGTPATASDDDIETALRAALSLPDARVKDAATAIAARFGLPRRDVYQLALRLAENEDET